MNAGKKVGDLFERALRRGKTDALETSPGDGLKTLEAESEVCAALGGDQGMDLINNDRLDGAQSSGGFRGQ